MTHRQTFIVAVVMVEVFFVILICHKNLRKERKKVMTNEMREIREAIQAGERALTSLRKAEEKLTSASNWGLWDIFGGGLISGIAKHSKMNEATSYMEEAKRNLTVFQRELRDVNGTYNLSLDIGGFLSFADFFFDGVIADYLVQTKINDAKIQVRDAIQSVSGVLAQLKTKAV